MLKAARIFALGGFLVIAACFEIDLQGLDNVCVFSCPFVPGQTVFALAPSSERILRGDTLSFYTYTCAEWFCETDGNLNSRWSIEGDAAGAGLAPDALSKTVASAPRILVHGVAVGQSTITAIAVGDSTQSGSAVLHVADSSAIVGLKLVAAGPDSIRLSGQLGIFTELRDGSGNLYRTQPGDWSISDSSVAQLAIGRLPFGGRTYYLVEPKTPGTVEVTATFRHLSAKLQVTVVP
ncbi:MAG: hypothetical protein ACRENU_09235 [Gemmatimonadaceae bacterium]